MPPILQRPATKQPALKDPAKAALALGASAGPRDAPGARDKGGTGAPSEASPDRGSLLLPPARPPPPLISAAPLLKDAIDLFRRPQVTEISWIKRRDIMDQTPRYHGESAEMSWADLITPMPHS